MLKCDIKITQIDGASCQENTPQASNFPVHVSRGFSFSERTDIKMEITKVCNDCLEEFEETKSKCSFCGSVDYDVMDLRDLEEIRTGGLDNDI